MLLKPKASRANQVHNCHLIQAKVTHWAGTYSSSRSRPHHAMPKMAKVTYHFFCACNDGGSGSHTSRSRWQGQGRTSSVVARYPDVALLILYSGRDSQGGSCPLLLLSRAVVGVLGGCSGRGGAPEGLGEQLLHVHIDGFILVRGGGQQRVLGWGGWGWGSGQLPLGAADL